MEKLGYTDFLSTIRAASNKMVSVTVELDDGTVATLDVLAEDESKRNCAVLLVTDEESLLSLGRHNIRFWEIVLAMIFERWPSVQEIVEMKFMLHALQEMKSDPLEELMDALKREG